MVTHRGPGNGTGHNNGRHIKKRRQMSRKTLYRLTVALWLIAAFTAGAITELLVDRIG